MNGRPAKPICGLTRTRQFLALIGIVAILASGCSWQQAFYSAQGWQRNMCSKLPDQTERERCLSNSSMTYEEYHRQAAGEKK